MEELDINNLYALIVKNKKFIAYFTLTILIVTFLITLVWPKTFESTSEIQLAQLAQSGQQTTQTMDIFSVIESKNIVESSSVIMPVINKYCHEISYEDFIKDNLYVNIISERIGKDEKAINYLQISVFYKNAETTKKINDEIINNFFEYTKSYYDERYDVLIKDKYETNANVAQLEKDIQNTESQIASISNEQLTTEGISKSTLLTSILSGYKTRLSVEQDKRIDIENKLANKREYKIISEPSVPDKPSSPNLWINLLISLIVSFVLSLIILLQKER